MRKAKNRVAAFELADKAMRLQLSNNGDLSEIESLFEKALSLDADSIEVLQEAAHFYDAVMPNARKSRKLAASCRAKAVKVAAEMDGIIKGKR